MNPALDHIVLNVRDLDSMLDFYIDSLGLIPERVDAYRQGRVPFPSLRINEQSIIDLLPEVPRNGGGGKDAESGPNLNHFCLAMGKVEWRATMDRLAAAGIDIGSGPMTLYGARGNGQAVYVSDPDGNRVELRYYEA